MPSRFPVALAGCFSLFVCCAQRESPLGQDPNEGSVTNSAAPAVTSPGVPSASVAAPSTSVVQPPSSSSAEALVPTWVEEVPVLQAEGAEKKGSLTVAFDGSQRFALWLDLLRFARETETLGNQRPHFTFFVNACFYSTDPGKSDVGRAHSRGELLVRRALTQMAINDGHEIANHGALHIDGSRFTKEAWREEFERFDALLENQLFVPVRDGQGKPVFPRFEPVASDGRIGARCASHSDCGSKLCVPIDDELGLCSIRCNLKTKCPEQTYCGAPMFRQDTDICLPLPKFPVELDGSLLFNEKGAAVMSNKRLVPYPIRGFRAPYLGANAALYDVLIERGYRYDTSQATHLRAPYRLKGKQSGTLIFEFPLMAHKDSASVPMDYNYRRLGIAGDRMQRDYETSIVAAHHRGLPWNIGHHFATWEDGAYLDALLEAVRFASAGCPQGAKPWLATAPKQCPGLKLVSFGELVDDLD